QIEVCEEELINLQGTIFGIDEDSSRILAKHEASKDEIAFKANELKKYVSVSNHAKYNFKDNSNLPKKVDFCGKHIDTKETSDKDIRTQCNERLIE
ncbi:unnamed protein product, partial [Rotaria socialis]